MTENFTRTDLACEWARDERDEGRGVRVTREPWRHGSLHRLCIESEAAARRLGRAVGEYVTVECGEIGGMDTETLEALEGVVSHVLLRMLTAETGKRPGGGMSVLVVGLGNADITADALGPCAVRELLVTRHLRELEPHIFARMECCAVSAMAPGVLGQTGMEAVELVLGAVRRCRPDVVIAIDALAARDCERLAATVQLGNTGIAPGTGIGNERRALDRETLGVPVIALGVPTVVDSSTLVYDALCRAGIDKIDERLRRVLENGRRFYVAPKEADRITARTALVLAHAINRALVGVAAI